MSGQLAMLESSLSKDPSPVSLLPEVQHLWHLAPGLFLGLDYDGTLVPIASRPEDARPSPAVQTLLTQLAHLSTVRVAILNGRPLSELLKLLPIPNLIYVGTHELELQTATGKLQRILPPGAFTSVIASLRREISASVGAYPGVVLEDKRQAVALHYRLANPKDGAQAVARFTAAVAVYQRKGIKLELVHGKHVVEVRPSGVNKGRALQSLLSQEAKGTLPLYIGDDATDEDAFRVIKEHGITIVVTEQPCISTARYTLRNPADVIEFLTDVLWARQSPQHAR
jgi:trehalose-phosphatase